MEHTELLIKDGWQRVLELFPGDLEESARRGKAIIRMRKIRDAGSLLRVILAYCLGGLSSRDLSGWLDDEGLAGMSSMALLKRLRWSAYWLSCLLPQMLEEFAAKPETELVGRNIIIHDATSVSRPRSEGTQRRIHLSLSLSPYRITALELTDASQGETFARMDVGPGDVVLGDRGYAQRPGIWHVLSHGGDVLVRTNYRDVPLVDESGDRFGIVEHLRQMEGQITQWNVAMRADERGGIPAVKGRLVARRLDAESAARARERVIQRAKRRHRQPDPESLLAAEFVLVFTTIKVEDASAEQVMELFRYRWQVEVVFHRLKDIIRLDQLPACSDELLDTIVLGRLIGALLIEKIGAKAGAFSPSGPERSSSSECLSGLDDDTTGDNSGTTRSRAALALA